MFWNLFNFFKNLAFYRSATSILGMRQKIFVKIQFFCLHRAEEKVIQRKKGNKPSKDSTDV